jgi:hypothetical protein
MARRDKLLERFRHQPADFTWDELVRLLRSFDYKIEAKGRTSRIPRALRPAWLSADQSASTAPGHDCPTISAAPSS